MNRTYHVIEFRAVDEDKRILEGIATTSDLALDGDIIETAGIDFQLPVPFLLRHKDGMELGNVIAADVLKDKIRVRV